MIFFYQDRKRFKRCSCGRPTPEGWQNGNYDKVVPQDAGRGLAGVRGGGAVVAINTSTELSGSLRKRYIGYQ